MTRDWKTTRSTEESRRNRESVLETEQDRSELDYPGEGDSFYQFPFARKCDARQRRGRFAFFSLFTRSDRTRDRTFHRTATITVRTSLFKNVQLLFVKFDSTFATEIMPLNYLAEFSKNS